MTSSVAKWRSSWASRREAGRPPRARPGRARRRALGRGTRARGAAARHGGRGGGDRSGERGPDGRRGDGGPRGGRAPLRGLPEPVRPRLTLRDGGADARHHPGAAGRRRGAGAGRAILRRQIWRVDPPVATGARVQPARVGGPGGVRAGRARRRRRPAPAVDAAARPAGHPDRPGAPRADPPSARLPAVTRILLVAATIGIPALAFALWPLLRRGGAPRSLPTPQDPREQPSHASPATD